MASQLHILRTQLDQALSAYTTTSPTTPSAHTSPITHTSPIAYTSSITYTLPIAHTSTIAHTSPIVHAPPIAHISPIAHTTPPSHTHYSHQVEESLVPSDDMEQGTSDFFTQQDYTQQDNTQQDYTQQDNAQQDYAQQVQNLQKCIHQLQANNTALHTQIQKLNVQCATLQQELDSAQTQLAEIRASRSHQQTSVREWHQRANSIIGAEHSRVAPSYVYKCAHARNGGCNWRNKRVTLQAYVLHLQRKHRQKISNNPDVDLLPVRS